MVKIEDADLYTVFVLIIARTLIIAHPPLQRQKTACLTPFLSPLLNCETSLLIAHPPFYWNILPRLARGYAFNKTITPKLDINNPSWTWGTATKSKFIRNLDQNLLYSKQTFAWPWPVCFRFFDGVQLSCLLCERFDEVKLSSWTIWSRYSCFHFVMLSFSSYNRHIIISVCCYWKHTLCHRSYLFFLSIFSPLHWLATIDVFLVSLQYIFLRLFVNCHCLEYV